MAFISAVIAQVEGAIPGGLPALFFGYGPLGAFCLFLTRLVDSLRKELQSRDELLRDVTDKNVAALKEVTHRFSGLERALILNAATHGTGHIKEIAQRRVEEWERKDRDRQ